MPPAAVRSIAPAFASTGGASFDDSAASNRVLAVVAGLVVIAAVLIAVTAWFWRVSRPEHPALAPLQLIGTRRFRRSAPEARRKALAELRAPADDDGEGDDEHVDLAALAARDLPPVDELAEPVAVAEPEEHAEVPAGPDGAPGDAAGGTLPPPTLADLPRHHRAASR